MKHYWAGVITGAAAVGLVVAAVVWRLGRVL